MVSEPVPGEAGLSACQRPDWKPSLAILGLALAREGQVISGGSRHVTNVMLTAIARGRLPIERPWPQRKLGSSLQVMGGGGDFALGSFVKVSGNRNLVSTWHKVSGLIWQTIGEKLNKQIKTNKQTNAHQCPIDFVAVRSRGQGPTVDWTHFNVQCKFSSKRPKTSSGSSHFAHRNTQHYT